MRSLIDRSLSHILEDYIVSIRTNYVLYLLGFFVMITLALFRILPVNYLGGIVILLFIGGLFYFWLNAWRQTKMMISVKSTAKISTAEKETELERKQEEPIVAR